MKLQTKLATYAVLRRPEIFQKVAAEFLASEFPGFSAALDDYDQVRQQQQVLKAQRAAAMFPALHSTQPAMYYANQQLMLGDTPDMAAAQPHYWRHRHRE